MLPTETKSATELAAKLEDEKEEKKEEKFKAGMPLLSPFSKYRDETYDFKELHSAPNRREYVAYVKSMPNQQRSEAEKKNLKILSKPAGRSIEHGAKNEWLKHVGRNAPCPCGSGLKFKKCHMLIMRTDRPVSDYVRRPVLEGK